MGSEPDDQSGSRPGELGAARPGGRPAARPTGEGDTVVRVLIVDDSELVRLGLQSLFDMHGDLEVCGTAPNGHVGILLAVSTLPDVVVMDLSLPDIDGVETSRRILRDRPGTRVVMLTGNPSPSSQQAAAAVGVEQYLHKGTPPEALLAAVRGGPGEPRLDRSA